MMVHGIIHKKRYILNKSSTQGYCWKCYSVCLCWPNRQLKSCKTSVITFRLPNNKVIINRIRYRTHSNHEKTHLKLPLSLIWVHSRPQPQPAAAVSSGRKKTKKRSQELIPKLAPTPTAVVSKSNCAAFWMADSPCSAPTEGLHVLN